MKNIAIIGVGALGRRHLQSMVDLQDDYDIYAVEINKDSFPKLNVEFPNVEFITTVDELPKELEAVVIATNSNVRRLLFEQLVNNSTVKTFFLKKYCSKKKRIIILSGTN